MLVTLSLFFVAATKIGSGYNFKKWLGILQSSSEEAAGGILQKSCS